MASRRGAANSPVSPSPEKSEAPPNSDDDRTAVPTQVLYKLIIYTVLVIFAPITMYYVSLNRFYDGNSTYAGATAALTANVILLVYIIFAIREDQGDNATVDEKKKKKDT